MPTNPYFNQISFAQEQTLVEDLVVESIQIHGQNFYYIKRDQVTQDSVFNEDVLSEFNDAYELEMYIEDAEGFAGEGDFLSKFGLQIRDQLNVLVSKKRFLESTPLTIPREGDLIYFPLVDRCFEIQFVEDEIPFYQLGKMYVYKLTTELFEYSHEEFNTEIEEIDDITEQNITTTIVTETQTTTVFTTEPDVDNYTGTVDSVIDFSVTNPFSEDY